MTQKIFERDKIILLYEKFKNFLTQNQKQILYLFLFEDLSYGEIANILATTRTAIYDCVKKAILKLKKVNEKMIH